MRPLWHFVWLTGLAAFIHAGTAVAQSYPTKPIRIVVPFTPGGELDNLARLIGQNMTDALKQAVLIENRPGADGRIGADLVAKAAPDGHTILMTTGILAIGPALYRNLPFDAATDFARVSQLLAYPLVLVAGPKVPAASIGELIALAKSRPGELNYGRVSVGGQPHLAMELLKRSTGIDMLAIPYKGVLPIQLALGSGEVDVAFIAINTAVQWAKSGRARALGVSSTRRSAALPDVPTVAEAGVAGFEVDNWQGLFVPAKTSRHIIGLIQQTAVKALNTPEIRLRLEASGSEIVGSTPEEFDAKFKADLAKFARIIREARIPLLD